MVQFGKKLLESRFEPWADSYLDYQGLKQCLKRYKRKSKKTKQRLSLGSDVPPPPPLHLHQDHDHQQQDQGGLEETTTSSQALVVTAESPRPFGSPQPSHGSASEHSLYTHNSSHQPFQHHQQYQEEWYYNREFEPFLEEEVEKIGLFFLQVQGELATDLLELRRQQMVIDHELSYDATTSIADNTGTDDDESATDAHDAEPSPSKTINKLQQLYSDFLNLSCLLLRFIHFVENNVTGIRKILKKHDKITKTHLTHQFVVMPSLAKNRHLKHLWTNLLLHHYEGITALYNTLKVAIADLKRLEYQLLLQQQQQQHISDLNSGLAPIAGATNNEPPAVGVDNRRAQKPPLPPTRHQPHNSMPNIVLTQADLAATASWQGTMQKSGGMTPTMQLIQKKSLTPQMFSSKKPYGVSPFFVGSGDATIAITAHELDTMMLKIEAARRRLNISSTTFQDLLAAQIMLEPTGEDALHGDDDEEEEDEARREGKGDDKWLSHFLNLTSTFLYMTNYYVVAPTSGHYAKMLGGDEALAGIIIGMTPIAALVSTILYSWWTSHSYKAALLFASSCSILGNIFYALGLPCHSLTLVMIGRLLNGFGSARSINRRYIADTFPPRARTAASANFVTAGALGMAAGPALASLLSIGSSSDDTTNLHPEKVHEHTVETIIDDNGVPMTIITDDDAMLHASHASNVWWTPENAPGWFMFVVWSTFWILLWFYFEDPPKHTSPPIKSVEMHEAETGENAALIATKQQETFDSDGDERNSDLPLSRNIPVITTFIIYFVLKLVLECILSSTATLTSFYFNWDSSVCGIYLAILGLLMLPANLGVAVLARNYDDRELIVGCEAAMLVGCCGVIQYTSKDSYSAVQYVLFSIVIFLSTNAMEGPNMSLLSKTIPKSWSRGIFNVGLLATEAGTLGRAVGDLLLSVWGFKGLGTLLNDAFRSMSILSGVTLALTLFFYQDMHEHEKDD